MTTKEEWEEISKKLEEEEKETKRVLALPEVVQRNKLFKNWLAHGRIIDVLSLLHCPNHPEHDWRHLKWDCCDMNLEEAIDILKQKLEKTKIKRR
jgi:hypothetical protein